MEPVMTDTPWSVVVSRPAASYLQSLSGEERERVRLRLKALEAGPFGQATRLQVRPQWSLRVGGLRVLLEVDVPTRTVRVVAAGPRGDIYKKP